ncbi:MAG: DUF4861 domain-containing protein [Verrucomicrobiales bacterium]|jgi:hypothetical protein|nr:DUF4861 domain-containing protein [Verrucomicrobiales bacterium]
MNKLIGFVTLTASLLAVGANAGVKEADTDTRAQAKYIPQRADDIAWENDKIAYRIYGPKLAVTEPTGSGIDVWVKSTQSMVIDRWYKAGNYHEDHGEGLDFYGVGHSRGCGGLGIWDGKELHNSGHWDSYEIKESGANRAVFEVKYAPWDIGGGRKISETRTFELAADSNLNKLTSLLAGDAGEVTVGIGIAKGPGGEIYQDKEKGILAYWQKADKNHGIIGCGVVTDPKNVVGFAENKLNHLILVRVRTGVPFTYYAGACWDRGCNAVASFDEWKNYLTNK